jgi:hypothetical protein
MKSIKIISVTLNIIWSIALVIMAVGLFLGKLTFWPDDPVIWLDYALAVVLIMLAALTLFNHKVGFWVSAVLFILCAIFDGYGYLITHDSRCWPGAIVAGFGVIFLSVKILERRKQSLRITPNKSASRDASHP